MTDWRLLKTPPTCSVVAFRSCRLHEQPRAHWAERQYRSHSLNQNTAAVYDRRRLHVLSNSGLWTGRVLVRPVLQLHEHNAPRSMSRYLMFSCTSADGVTLHARCVCIWPLNTGHLLMYSIYLPAANGSVQSLCSGCIPDIWRLLLLHWRMPLVYRL